MKNAAIKEYINNPLFFLYILVDNAIAFWTRGGTRTSTILNTILNVPIIFMTIFGIFLQIRRRQCFVPILLPILFIYIVHLPIFGQLRAIMSLLFRF